MYTKWITIWEDPCITGCMDPLTECMMDKIQFHTVYQPILDQLDGIDYTQSVEYFFNVLPTNTTCMGFVDQEAKDDFLEWAVDSGVLPQLNEIQAGEDITAKEERDFLELEEVKEVKEVKEVHNEPVRVPKNLSDRRSPFQKHIGPLQDLRRQLEAARKHLEAAKWSKLQKAKQHFHERIKTSQDDLGEDYCILCSEADTLFSQIPASGKTFSLGCS